MRRFAQLALIAFFLTLSACATSDSRLVGNWEGQRDMAGSCKFLSWKASFLADGNFSITFFRDPAKKQTSHIERGKWKASNQQIVLTTEGVTAAEVYQYKVVDQNTVSYVNIIRDSTANCEGDYQFTNHRIPDKT